MESQRWEGSGDTCDSINDGWVSSDAYDGVTKGRGDFFLSFLLLCTVPRHRYPAWRAGNDNPICRTGPQSYIGWWNGSLWIDSCLLKRLQKRAPTLFTKASHHLMCTLSTLKQGKAKMKGIFTFTYGEINQFLPNFCVVCHWHHKANVSETKLLIFSGRTILINFIFLICFASFSKKHIFC